MVIYFAYAIYDECCQLRLFFQSPAIAGKKEKIEEEQWIGACEIPALEPAERYPWEQTRDNVTIKLTVTPVTTKIKFWRGMEQKRSLIQIGDVYKYKITETPVGYICFPDSLVLALHIVNNMGHVLRFNGAMISCMADGKSMPLNQKGQDELLKAVLTPYASLDVSIVGPAIETIKKVGTITLSIYDVITEVDAANNPTKRTTFEWILQNRVTTVRDTLEVKQYEAKMTEREAKQKAGYRYWGED